MIHPDPPPGEMAVRSRYRRASHHAKRAYPGPVGELLAREILSYEEWGYRLDPTAVMPRVVEQVLTTPIPQGEEAA